MNYNVCKQLWFCLYNTSLPHLLVEASLFLWGDCLSHALAGQHTTWSCSHTPKTGPNSTAGWPNQSSMNLYRERRDTWPEGCQSGIFQKAGPKECSWTLAWGCPELCVSLPRPLIPGATQHPSNTALCLLLLQMIQISVPKSWLQTIDPVIDWTVSLPKRYVEILTPNTFKWGLIWR